VKFAAVRIFKPKRFVGQLEGMQKRPIVVQKRKPEDASPKRSTIS